VRYYFGRDVQLADSLEVLKRANIRRTKTAKQLQNAPSSPWQIRCKYLISLVGAQGLDAHEKELGIGRPYLDKRSGIAASWAAASTSAPGLGPLRSCRRNICFALAAWYSRSWSAVESKERCPIHFW
jgi:hypothetical protein